MLVPCSVSILQLSHSIFWTFTQPDPDDLIFKSRSEKKKNQVSTTVNELQSISVSRRNPAPQFTEFWKEHSCQQPLSKGKGSPPQQQDQM